MRALAALFVAGMILAACAPDTKRENNPAQENARRYLFNELGSDTAYYEEISWGELEARRLEFNESEAYRRYNDSVQRMEQRMNSLNDSIARATERSSTYTEMTMRRMRYEQDLEQFRQREPDFRRDYEQHPEFDGYWLEHQYRVKKDPPIRVKILLGDTVKYTPSGMIYR